MAFPAALGGPFAGVRATPGYQPSPNSQPTGALTGVPPRSQIYAQQIRPDATRIVMATPENRIVICTAPLLGWNIFVGDESVNTRGTSGMQLPSGVPFSITIPGLQDLWAITNAPLPIPLQLMVSIILLAERQREVG